LRIIKISVITGITMPTPASATAPSHTPHHTPHQTLDSTFETILVQRNGAVLTLALNRPDVFNACNGQMATDLQTALRLAAEDSSVRCVVLTGAGKAFCSGQDLREFPDMTAIDFSATIRTRYNPTIRAMRDLPQPIIAGINGAAAGAGLSLALGCDLRVMSSAARLIEGFTAIALIPDAGGTYFYTKLMGYAKAFEFVALNEPITAENAVQSGLVNRVVAEDEFASALQAMAQKIAAQPTHTLALAKRLLQQAVTGTLDASLDAEAIAQHHAGTSQDFARGIAAFTRKEAPVFVGK
jgi:2-(1,2-epoxy-1,2-dihydrophenyl)acetyl-CoA isomerase